MLRDTNKNLLDHEAEEAAYLMNSLFDLLTDEYDFTEAGATTLVAAYVKGR